MSTDIRFSRQHFITGSITSKADVLFLHIGPTSFEAIKNIICTGIASVHIHKAADMPLDSCNMSLYPYRNMQGVSTLLELLQRFVNTIDNSAKINLLDGSIDNVMRSVNNAIVVLCDVPGVALDYISSINSMCRTYGHMFIMNDTVGSMLVSFSDCDTYTTKSKTMNPDIDNVIVRIKDAKTGNNGSIVLSCYDSTSLFHGRSTVEIVDHEHIPHEVQIISVSDYDIVVTPPSVSIHDLKGWGIRKCHPFKRLIHRRFSSSITSLLDIQLEQGFITDRRWYLYTLLYYAFKDGLRDADEIRNRLEDMIGDGCGIYNPNHLHVDWTRYISGIIASLDISDVIPTYTIQGGMISNILTSVITREYISCNQWFYINALISQDKVDIISLRDRIRRLKVLQVGCGATGCETLKQLSMMDIDKVSLCDYDSYASSNRNRQFLCTEKDIGTPKVFASKANVSSWTGYNNIDAYNVQCCDASLDILRVPFMDADIIIACVDNVMARRYLCEMSKIYGKYFIECGTSVLELSTFCYDPKTRTQTYQMSKSKSKSAASEYNCNPKVYCYSDVHAISSSVDTFNAWFHDYYCTCFETSVDTMSDNHKAIRDAYTSHDTNPDVAMEILFNRVYNDDMISLRECENEGFWNDLRRKPIPVSYDKSNEDHIRFRNTFMRVLKRVMIDGNATVFCKDDDDHIDMITEMTAIKCQNFDVQFKDRSRYRVQLLAGHITPSIISTSAISSGLMCLQLYGICMTETGQRGMLYNNYGSLTRMIDRVDLSKVDKDDNINIPIDKHLGQLYEDMAYNHDATRIDIISSSGSYVSPSKYDGMLIRDMGTIERLVIYKPDDISMHGIVWTE